MFLHIRHRQAAVGLGYTQSLKILMVFLSLAVWLSCCQDVGG